MPAAGAGLPPQVLVCPGAINWEGWDPEVATGQTEGMSALVGGIHIVFIYIYVSLLMDLSIAPERTEG